VGSRGGRADRPGLRGPRPDHVRVRRHVQGRAEPDQDPGALRDGVPGQDRGPLSRRSAALRVRLVDAGPHPNPAKAADGKRLHRLEPDPVTAPVVVRIFAEYLDGRGLFAIAEGLTRDHIPSPSQYDHARNRHRTGEGWSKAAVRAILANPRYTGRQVWNKQCKEEVLLDVHEVALDAGADPVTVADWTRTVTAQRAAALARAAARPASSGTPLTEGAIQQIVQALGDIRDTIQDADPADKARIYNRLDLRLTYHPGKNLIHAQANLDPRERGGMGSVRGGLEPRSWWYIPKRGIHHHSKLTRQGWARPHFADETGAAVRAPDRCELITCGNYEDGRPR